MTTRDVVPSSACAPRTLGLLAVSLLLAFTLAGPPGAHAASSPPDRMTYQGYLVDQNGAPLAPTTPVNYTIVFRIYDAAEGGNTLWSEQQVVTVDKGNFSVILGEGADVSGESRGPLSQVFVGTSASERYLGITVTIGGNPLQILPRLRLLPAPYAFLATQASQLVNPSTGAAFMSLTAGEAVVPNTTRFGNDVFFGTGAYLRNDQGGVLELGDSTANNVIPYVDFHYGTGTVQDYNIRLINDANQRLSLLGGRLSFGSSLSDTKIALWESGSGMYGMGIQGSQFRLHVDKSTSRFSFLNQPGGAGTSELMTILGTGNVGIGATSPNAKLSLGGNLANTKLALWDGGSSSAAIGFGVQDRQFRIHLNAATDRFSFLNGVNGTEVMTILGNGNVGMGTISPNARLSFGNNLANTKLALWDNGGSQAFGFGIQAGQFRIHVNTASDRFAFLNAVNGTEVMTIRGNGNVGVGNNNPPYTMTLNSRGQIGQARMRIEHGTSYADFGRWDTYAYVQLNNSYHSTGLRFASYDGDSNWDFNSDRKLKKDIVDAEPMLDRVMKVPVRRYRWKEDAPDATHKLGVIAQEVQPLFPEMVSEVESPNQSGEKVLTVGYSDFGVIAIKAIQELKAHYDAELSSLKTQLAEVVRENKELRGQLASTAARPANR